MSEHDVTYCEECGAPDDGTQTFCEKCGAALVDPKYIDLAILRNAAPHSADACAELERRQQ